MTLLVFLDRLRRAPVSQQRHFNDEARASMLRALYKKQSYARGADLEDAVNEVFADLLAGKVSGFVCAASPQDPAFSAALLRFLAWHIAPNKLVDIYRRTGREVLIGDMLNANEPTDESMFERLLAGFAAPSAQDIVDAGQRLTRLRHCIGMLPEKIQAVVTLLLGELRQDEIAERLDIPIGTVKSRLSKAMELLARCMGVAGNKGRKP